MIDNGSLYTIADEPTYKMMVNKPILTRCNKFLYGYQSKKPIDFIGEFESTMRFNNKIASGTVLVAKGKSGNVLEADLAKELGLPHQWDPANSIDTKQQIMNIVTDEMRAKYPHATSGELGLYKLLQAHIDVNSNIPGKIIPFRTIAYHLRNSRHYAG